MIQNAIVTERSGKNKSSEKDINPLFKGVLKSKKKLSQSVLRDERNDMVPTFGVLESVGDSNRGLLNKN